MKVDTSPFVAALAREPLQVPPIWCMRQAGRYQRSYRSLRERHSFEDLCRRPELATEVALNAVREFDFDAAILFSDLLFPLNALGLPLSYDDGGPHLAARLHDVGVGRLRTVDEAAAALRFQADAVALTRNRLDAGKGLIGFVGGPWTLFVYAMEGTHTGSLVRSKSAMPLYREFTQVIVPLLERAARAQLDAGADVVMIFDTAAGEVTPAVFGDDLAPDLRRLASALPQRLGYYAKGLHPAHLSAAAGTRTDRDGPAALGPMAGFGFDWRWDLRERLAAPDRGGFVQGNFDPACLHLTGERLDRAIAAFLDPVASLAPGARTGWICGLGHGVLPGTPEASVATFVRSVRERLS